MPSLFHRASRTHCKGKLVQLPSNPTLGNHWASLVAQRLKRLPGMQETWVQSLGWEDPLEKETAIHSSTLAWRIPWTEEPDGLQSKESDSTERLHSILMMYN